MVFGKGIIIPYINGFIMANLKCHLERQKEYVLYIVVEGGGMQIKESVPDKRLNQRLNLSFEISLPEQKGKTINISAGGVYFEVITNDIDAFAPGAIIPLQISAVDSNERKLNLSGEGLITREDIKESSSAASRLCIAVQFTEKLNVDLGSS